ncbi:putative transposase [Clostridium puniceum]|uniref:Putative transposase n=1 Tax=Clostridium puniceum TaxID=29367 RepID=A0A1S8TX07_9CLOT|nr:putative transposase [Clostridium puniceum]
MYAKEWIVYSKAPYKSASHVLKYLGRYTHRVAISNYRILNIKEKYNYKKWYIARLILFPVAGIKTSNAKNLNQEICNYTEEDRKRIHDNLRAINHKILNYIMENPVQG